MDTRTSDRLTTERLHFILLPVPKKTPSPSSTEKAEFHRRVRAWRVKSGKTRAQMAQALGCPQDTYNRHETKNEMKRLRLVAFCDFTGADIHWLMSGQIRTIGLTDKEIEQYIADDPEPGKDK